MICKTVNIQAQNESGFVIINESDFDPSKHKLYVEGEEAQAESLPIDTVADEPINDNSECDESSSSEHNEPRKRGRKKKWQQ